MHVWKTLGALSSVVGGPAFLSVSLSSSLLLVLCLLAFALPAVPASLFLLCFCCAALVFGRPPSLLSWIAVFRILYRLGFPNFFRNVLNLGNHALFRLADIFVFPAFWQPLGFPKLLPNFNNLGDHTLFSLADTLVFPVFYNHVISQTPPKKK